MGENCGWGISVARRRLVREERGAGCCNDADRRRHREPDLARHASSSSLLPPLMPLGGRRAQVSPGRSANDKKSWLDARTPAAYAPAMAATTDPAPALPEPAPFDPVPVLVEELSLPHVGVSAAVKLLAEG